MNNTLFAMGLMVLASATANAGPVVVEGNPAPSERVSFADLNMDSPAGIHTLKGRIKSAANRVCLINNKVESLPTTVGAKRCRVSAIGDAYGQMDRLFAARDSGVSLVAMAVTVRSVR